MSEILCIDKSVLIRFGLNYLDCQTLAGVTSILISKKPSVNASKKRFRHSENRGGGLDSLSPPDIYIICTSPICH